MKVLKFGAVWCNGCLVMKPKWEEIEDKNPELKTRYYDYDNDKAAVKKYEIDEGRLPCFVWLDKKGKELFRVNGEISVDKLVEINDRYKDK
jgi:thiol-disulfide isomerase/thioredoxin